MKTDELFNTNPFDFSKKHKDLFLDSLKETALHHYEHNAFIKYLWDKHSFHPSYIDSEESIEKIPFTLVNIFKHYEQRTGASEDIVLTLGSSGTGGQRSLIHLDQLSLDRVKKLAYVIHEAIGITSSKKYNYLCFTYDPSIANDLGTAFTDELLTSFTDKEEVFYTFQHNGHDFFFDEEQTVAKLKEFEKSPYATRILGFPAFLFKIITKYNLKLNLGSDSWVQTGGGWKGDADKEINKQSFRRLINESLGIPVSNIRDLFGMVEHGIPYVDCPDGKLRVPNYARVLIRDPKTLEVLPNGSKGLIQFICSYNTSYPAFSLLTTDWGVKNVDEFSEYIEIKGRAGLSKNKGCAIQAAQML